MSRRRAIYGAAACLLGPTLFSGCGPKPAAPSATTASPAVEYEIGKNGRPLFVSGCVCDRDVVFFIDTNATYSLLDPSFQSSLGPPLRSVNVKSTGDVYQSSVFASPEFQLGSLRVKPNGPVLCHDFTELLRASATRFQGVLGMDVLSRFVMQIRFDDGVLRLLHEASDAERISSQSVPLDFDNGVPLVDVRCGEVTHPFRIDTGSTDNCVEFKTFDHLIRSSAVREGPTYLSATQTGPVRARSGLLHTAQIGEFLHRDVLINEGPMSILGLPFLARYHITFDFPRAIAYLKPGAHFATPDSLGTSGIAITPVNGRLLVVNVKPEGPAFEHLQPNDVVLAINQEPATQLDMFRVRQLLTAAPGSPVNIQASRNGAIFTAEFQTGDRLAR